MLRFILILAILSVVYSCAPRKVSVTKTETEKKIDSVYSEKKDSVVVQQNAIQVKEESSEIEITPIDTSKPVIIGETKYYNAKISIKKKKKDVVDSTKTTINKSESKDISVKKKEFVSVKEKKSDKKFDYSIFFWIVLFLAAAYFTRRLLPK